MPFPERRAAPQAIELFDLAIAFWFGHRQENQFDAEVQAQPHELAEDPRGFVAATKRGVVVELQKVWNSQGFQVVRQWPMTVGPLLSVAMVCAHARVRRLRV